MLKSGTTIICDRYYYSGMVYSAAKRNPTLSLAWARRPEVGLPRPDVVVFLNISSEDAELRGGYGEEKYEKRDMQEEVRRLFVSLRDGETEEHEDMTMVDAGRSVDVIAADVLQRVHKAMEVVKNNNVDSGDSIRRVIKWKDNAS